MKINKYNKTSKTNRHNNTSKTINSSKFLKGRDHILFILNKPLLSLTCSPEPHSLLKTLHTELKRIESP